MISFLPKPFFFKNFTKKHFYKNFFLNSLFKLRREFNHSEFEIWFDYSVIESIYDIFFQLKV